MEIIMKKLGLISVLAALLATPVMAESSDKVPGSDGSSGCGYGWEVTKGRTLSASSTRGTTNATASNTIAMTMGTSGCEKHDIVLKNREQEYFAELNYENLVAQMAEGQGETLAHFAGLMGCQDSEAFSSVAQENFLIMAGNSPMSMLNNVRSAMGQNSNLKKSCM
jgi:hypothetical protein